MRRLRSSPPASDEVFTGAETTTRNRPCRVPADIDQAHRTAIPRDGAEKLDGAIRLSGADTATLRRPAIAPSSRRHACSPRREERLTRLRPEPGTLSRLPTARKAASAASNDPGRAGQGGRVRQTHVGPGHRQPGTHPLRERPWPTRRTP